MFVCLSESSAIFRCSEELIEGRNRGTDEAWVMGRVKSLGGTTRGRDRGIEVGIGGKDGGRDSGRAKGRDNGGLRLMDRKIEEGIGIEGLIVTDR